MSDGFQNLDDLFHDPVPRAGNISDDTSSLGGDPLKLYLYHVSRIKRLTAEDTVVLAERLVNARENLLIELCNHFPTLQAIHDLYDDVARGIRKPREVLRQRAPRLLNDEAESDNPELLEIDQAYRTAENSLNLPSSVSPEESCAAIAKSCTTLLGLNAGVASNHGQDFEALDHNARQAKIISLIDLIRAEPLQDKWLEEIVESKSLPPEVKNSFSRFKNIRNQMINGHLGFVISIAKKYKDHGLQLLDHIQEGNVGLIRAIEKFDHTKGYAFSTYAAYWIKQQIRRSRLKQGSTIQLSANRIAEIRLVLGTSNDMERELRRRPTPEELAKKLQMRTGDIQAILMDAQSEPVSFDMPVGEDRDAVLGDFIEDKETLSPLAITIHNSLRQQTARAITLLMPIEERVLRMRYGIGVPAHSPKEIRDIINITLEQIWKIETKALRKLKNPAHSRTLRLFLGA